MDIRNATASWSGYSHQGKVGIMLALKEIHIQLGKDEENYNEKSVEFESAEDIDIKYGSTVISRHQVKAYKDGKTLKQYEDVLNVQVYQYIDGKKVLTTKGFQIRTHDDEANPLDIEVDENSRYLHTICEIKGFGLSKEEYEKLPHKPTFVENPNEIKLYEYPEGKKYCDISTSDLCKKICIDLIKVILKQKDHIFKEDDVQQEYIYFELLNALALEIQVKHIDNGYPLLRFSDIMELILSTKKHEKQNIAAVRGLFTIKWEEFISGLYDSDLDFEEAHLICVNKKLKELFSLSNTEFIQFLYDINPDKKVSSIETLESITELCKWDDLKYMFFECLIKVVKEDYDIAQRGYMKDGGYLLTLITGSKSSINRVMNSIITNSNITRGIFEKKYLVNREIDDVVFGNHINNLTEEKSLYRELKSNWKNSQQEGKFYNPEMSFITYDKTEVKLKGV